MRFFALAALAITATAIQAERMLMSLTDTMKKEEKAILHGLPKGSKKCIEEKLQEILPKIDTDGDKKVSLKEAAVALKNLGASKEVLAMIVKRTKETVPKVNGKYILSDEKVGEMIGEYVGLECIKSQA